MKFTGLANHGTLTVRLFYKVAPPSKVLYVHFRHDL
jgi:hypothetical protein